ncbi:MAG: hypothetical protein KH375_01155 [Alistipes sp.]|nr:hypothetical protein [Alistipes sp.]
MNVKLYKEDIVKADALIGELADKSGISAIEYKDDEQYRRIIHVLQEHGYINYKAPLILRNNLTLLYESNGGAAAIYNEQQREDAIKKLSYRQLKQTQWISWGAFAISIISLVWQVFSAIFEW